MPRRPQVQPPERHQARCATLRVCRRDLRRIAELLEDLDLGAMPSEAAEPALAAAGLVAQSRDLLSHALMALDVDGALDRLISVSRWEHPAEVLDRPRPSYGALLQACDERLPGAEGDRRERLEEARFKIARARRVEEAARRRRRQARRERRRKNG